MSEQAATATTPAAPVTPAGPDMAAFSSLLGLPDDAPAAKPAQTSAAPPKPAPAAAPGADEDDASDPLDEALYAEDKLKTPEDIAKARGRLFRYLGKVNELQRKANRAHGAAADRERKLAKREETIGQRETRVSAIERLQSQAIEDFESGDTTRFLTAVGKLSKTGDPVGFWKNAAIALAKGEAFRPAEKAAMAADPELKQRLERLEQGIQERQEQEKAAREDAQIEELKTKHFETAKASTDKHPHLAAFCAEHPERAREGIAAVMLEELQRIGKPVDISTACGIIERELSARYELSQRVDGQTNGVKGTTGPEPDAGRETSKEPPKPETATVPAALASAPGSAMRAETEEELRARQIRELEQLGFFG
jgi:hypothetical protein